MVAVMTASPTEFKHFLHDYAKLRSTKQLKVGNCPTFDDGASFCMVSDVDDVRGREFSSFIKLEKMPTNCNEVEFAIMSRLIK